MVNRTNAATRLLAILERARQPRPPNSQALDCWCEVLEVAPTEQSIREREVARQLSTMQEELGAVRLQLEKQEIEKKTYDSALIRINSALSVTTIGGQFVTVQQHLVPETMSVLALVGQMLLNDEEDPLTSDEIQELLTTVGQLEETVTNGSLPGVVKRFLCEQLAIIRRGLLDYRIRGAAALQQASLDAAVHWATRPSSADSFRQNKEMVATRGLWGKITKYGARTLLIHALVAATISDVKSGIELVREVKQLQAPPVDTRPNNDRGSDSDKSQPQEERTNLRPESAP